MAEDSLLKRLVKEKNKLLKFALCVYNHLPFNNSVKKKGNKVKVGIAFLKKTKIRICGKNNVVIIDDGCRLTNCRIMIYGNDNVVKLSDFVTAYQAEFYIEDNKNEIICNRHTLFAGKIHLACTEGSKILVGEDCLFSSDVVVRTGDSHSILDAEGKRINPAKEVVFNNHVWVGYRALICKGASIPENSIVGTGAVVTKKFETPGICLAGNPAKIVKENINWDIQRI